MRPIWTSARKQHVEICRSGLEGGGGLASTIPHYAVVNPEALDDVVRSARRGSLDSRSCMQIAPCLNKYSPLLLVCGRNMQREKGNAAAMLAGEHAFM
jgi:hypothetical protein